MNAVKKFLSIMVKVKTWDMIIQIWGSNLSVNDFSSRGIYICGKIQSIELTGNG